MNVWINGRSRASVDYRDRGLQYGDGLFETMRVRGHAVRLLDYHLDRLYAGCENLQIGAPKRTALRRELEHAAAVRREAVLKLIVTRGAGGRGYRPTGRERCTRILALYPLPPALTRDTERAVRVRLCSTPLSSNPRLAGMKTLNRLESVLARSEWRGKDVWEGIMRDLDGHIVCGTMSNLFLTRGSLLMTPILDRCGVAGVMRRWIMENARRVGLTAIERRLERRDLRGAEEVFMSNALVGIKSIGAVRAERAGSEHRFQAFDHAVRLRALLETL